MEILHIIIGLALVLAGAHLLTEGAAATAERLGISQFAIGLTVIAAGTSMPEFVVSFSAALKGSSDMAVGNVVGSNILNVFLILGLCASISPLALTKRNVSADIPTTFAASVLLFVFASDRMLHVGSADRISRIEGAVMFLLYIVATVIAVRSSKRESRRKTVEPRMTMPKAALFIVAGLGGLIGGSRLFVDGASWLAARWGVSEAVIAITVVAGGTSLPELASGLVSVFKGQNDMALGNVLGSNLFNILFILGGCSVVSPLPLADIDTLDLSMVVLSALLPFIFAFTFRGRKINRIEGFMLLLIYALYLRHLLAK